MRALTLILLICFSTLTPGQNVTVKSLQAYGGNDPLSIPLVISSKELNQNLTIEFDIAAQAEPNLVIEFKFCDLNWQPYNNAFLYNQGRNTSQTLWFDNIKIPGSGANFHYKGSFPSFDVTFPFPGKWAFYIRDSIYRDKVYAVGYFYVVQNPLPFKGHINKEVLEGEISTPVELNRVYSIGADIVLPDSLAPANLMGIEIVENRKMFSPYQAGKNNSGFSVYSTDGGHRFNFTARNVRPGNGYRHLDLRDKAKYNFPETNAQFDGIEYSTFYNRRQQDLAGGELIENFRYEYAQYLKVKFRFRPPENTYKKVFLTGSFTNWAVLPQNELKNDNGLYTLDVELKRGEYDYQYVLADLIDGQVTNIDWYTLEGNFWETDNDYHIFLYYFTPEYGGYNKIIGYKKLRSGGL